MQTEPETTEIMESVDESIKTTIINILPMFKKIVDNMTIKKRNLKI